MDFVLVHCKIEQYPIETLISLNKIITLNDNNRLHFSGISNFILKNTTFANLKFPLLCLHVTNIYIETSTFVNYSSTLSGMLKFIMKRKKNYYISVRKTKFISCTTLSDGGAVQMILTPSIKHKIKFPKIYNKTSSTTKSANQQISILF